MKVTLPITVVAFETDFGGVVSNTRYLEYIERGRYALLHAAGLKVKDVWREHGVQPAVRHVEVDYLGFARHEDEMELEVECAECGRASATLKYLLRRVEDGAVLMRATQTLVFINERMKPSRTPEWFAAKFSTGDQGDTKRDIKST